MIQSLFSNIRKKIYFLATVLFGSVVFLFFMAYGATPIAFSSEIFHASLKIGYGSYNSVAHHPTEDIVVVGTTSGKVLFYTYNDTKVTLLRHFAGHDGRVNTVAFNFAGSKVVSGGSDALIKIWDIKTGTQIGSDFIGHVDKVNAVIFNPDGSKIVSSSSDNTIKIWDVKTGKHISSASTNHGDEVCSIIFSADGSKIISSGSDNTIKIWDVKTGKHIDFSFADSNDEVSTLLL